MKQIRLKMDIDYNFNELYIMVKTSVKISTDKISRDIIMKGIFYKLNDYKKNNILIIL
jgi:hypothetical protein